MGAIIVAAILSFVILLGLNNRTPIALLSGGRLAATVIQGGITVGVLIFVLAAGKDGEVFLLIAALIAAVFGFFFARENQKYPVSKATAIILAVIQAVLGALGGIILLLALGNAERLKNGGARSAQGSSDDFDAAKKAALDQAEMQAQREGYINADDMASQKYQESSASSAYDHGRL